MRLVATDAALSVVCVSVCVFVGHMGELCKNGSTDQDAIWRGDQLTWVQGTMGSRFPNRWGTFKGGHVPAIVMPTHECIAHCVPAAVSECACPAQAADECIHCCQG